VRGSNFGDTLTGSNSTFTEQFEGRGGNDTINGAGGTDMVRYDSATEAVNVNLATNTALDGLGGTDTLSNIEGIRGSSFADTLTGGNTANGTGTTDGFEFFMGQGGNDTIDGGGGYDRADYTSSTTGASVTLGGSSNGTASDGLGGTDTLISIEGVRGTEFNDTLTGSDTGTFETFEGRGGNDTIDGKGGTDRVDYTSATAAVTVNLGTNSASDGYGGTDTLLNIEQIRGSAFNDSLTGNTGNNDIQGQAGNDTLSGGDGNDSLDGNAGADSLSGGNGNDYLRGADGANDTLDGGADYDTANYTFSGTSPVTFTATGAGGFQHDGSGRPDTLFSIEEMHIFGGGGGDTLTGTSMRQYIQGNGGNDTLTGGAGNDTFAYDFGQASGTDRITDLQSWATTSASTTLAARWWCWTAPSRPVTTRRRLTRGQIMVGVPSGGVTKIYVGTDNTPGRRPDHRAARRLPGQ
jgi:Ca2+-binding RTX toxin-like protein